MFGTRVYINVALFIALAAFAVGQIIPGSGMIFAALASTMWTGCSVAWQRRLGRRC
jgi:hypothetical protein